MVRKAGRACFALALVLAAAACDDNPLAEDRDEAAYFRLNPADATVNAGGSILVDAVVVNQFGAATNDAVTATPCDSKVTAVADTSRGRYEFPERFRVTGVTLGTSCLVVSGGGIQDTVRVRVVPASIRLAGVDTVPSGSTVAGQLRFLTTTGTDATGFNTTHVTFTSLTPTIAVVDSAGRITGRAPGAGQIVTTLTPTFGATRVDTARFVVRAGPFTGTVAQSAATGGQFLTFTQGSIAFDADTEVRLQLPSGFFSTLTPSAAARASGTTITAMLPPGIPAGTAVKYDIINIGTNQVAVTGTFTTTAASPAVDTWGAATQSPTTAPTMTVFTDVFGTIPGVDQQAEEWFCFTAARTGSHTLTVHWDDGSDIDVYVTNAAGTSALLARETLANPETGSVTLTSGTRYCVLLFMWESAVPNREVPYRIRIQ